MWDDLKKEVITKWTTKFWPHYGTTSFKYIVSINSDTLEIRSAFQDSSVDNGLVIYWDITYPTSYSFPKIEEYMRENRNQIDNARAIGDQAIKLSQWERNTAAAGHVEGMVRGGLSGAGTGALIGSIVPGIGTAIGGVVGAIGGALTGGAISGGFNAYGVGNTKIDIAKLERQSIEAKLRDVKNQNPILKNNSNDYTNYMKSSSFRIYIRKNILEDVMYDVFFNYYNRFGSKYNIRINMNEIIENNKRKYWYFIQTENMYKDLDDYF
ncbi:MAG: hypothetical protein E7Y34_02460, partial [Mycoplasma sp.]|nr:hypothetical protein [Mycoplasma sp.]